MKHHGQLWVLLTSLLNIALLLPASSSVAAPAPQATPPSIHLKAATFTPAAGQQPALPPGLLTASVAGPRAYYIVQFAGPILQEWRDALTAAGAEIVAYLPDYAYKVRMNPGEANRMGTVPGVIWIGYFEPAYKLSPDLKLVGPHLYRVRVEQGADFGLTMAAIASSGAQVVQRDGDVLSVVADGSQVAAIAQVADVAWIENFAFKEKHNEVGGGVIMGGNTIVGTYNGSTQIAAVADTGLGDGTANGAHPDIPASRIQAIYDWTTGNAQFCYRVVKDGPRDVESGHGTHVAVSVVGDGGANGEGRGVAPAARLVFQAVEEYLDIYGACTDPTTPDGYYLIGIPDDLHNLFQQAYNAGARIHSNSWGSNAAGDYTLDSANTDDFIYDTGDMLVTFSAGNEGIDVNADGIVDNDSIGSPATAKNVLTVGASENERKNGAADSYPCDPSLTYTSRDAYQPGQTCQSMGGNNILGSYGSRWPADYPANPLKDDPTAGNREQMAAFSSRGPTDDGRIKPDVVAPGTWILSGYSSFFQEGYGDPVNPQINAYQMDGWGMPFNVAYKYFGGTSMSNPLAGGAATVVRDFYQKAYGVNASAALVKATLINSAVDMADENNDGANDNDFPIPNSHEGWGRINLVNATDGSAQFTQGSLASTGQSASYQFTVPGGAPFKISLVWSDSAAAETAAVSLVNNLDLTVTGPGDVTYRGNVFSGGWSATGGTADNRNNVENVYVNGAQAGTWIVTVSGFNVPSGPQPFALVVDGAGTTPVPTPTPTNTPLPTPTPTVTPTPAPSVLHVGDLDGARSGNRKSWTATVTITVHNGGHAPVNGATVSGAWSGGATGTATCTTNSAGQCSVSKSKLTATSATFAVSNVALSGYSYLAASNHDPDGDSTGTAITVARP